MNRTQLQQQVECPVCMDQFQTPKLLPCQHTFCLQCLQDIHNSDRGTQIRCPECRQQHHIPQNGVAGFPTSVSIQRLIEAMNQPYVPQSRVQSSAPPTRATRVTSGPAVTQMDNVVVEDEDQAIVRAISFVEHQEQLERNVNVSHGARMHSQTSTLRTVHQTNQNVHQTHNVQRTTDATPRSIFQRGRSAYRSYIGHLLHKDRQATSVPVLFMLTITFSRFIAGAVKLGSDCKDEQNVAVYSFVKSCFGFLFYVTIFVLNKTTTTYRALDNTFVQVWLIIHELFTIIWFFIGTAWVFGKYSEMKEDCPMYVENWNFHFINFILYLTVVDSILFVVFVFYTGYYLCHTERSDNVN